MQKKHEKSTQKGNINSVNTKENLACGRKKKPRQNETAATPAEGKKKPRLVRTADVRETPVERRGSGTKYYSVPWVLFSAVLYIYILTTKKTKEWTLFWCDKILPHIRPAGPCDPTSTKERCRSCAIRSTALLPYWPQMPVRNA
jgi:hypothetical protein